MKTHLAGKQYRTDDEIISAVEDFFKDQDESFYKGNRSIATPMHFSAHPFRFDGDTTDLLGTQHLITEMPWSHLHISCPVKAPQGNFHAKEYIGIRPMGLHAAPLEFFK